MNPRVLYRAASYATDARSAADSVISALTPAAWYRNATGVTESGGFASQWDDYSGNGRHLVQGVGTNQPAYSAGVLTFDGVDNWMRVSFALAQPMTIVAVMKQVTWTGGDYIMDGASVNEVAAYQNTITPNFMLSAGAPLGNNGNLAINTYGIVCLVANGASSSSRVNDTAKVSGSTGTNALTGYTIGAAGNSGSASNIATKEIVIFPSALSDANQSAVITALNNALTVF